MSRAKEPGHAHEDSVLLFSRKFHADPLTFYGMKTSKSLVQSIRDIVRLARGQAVVAVALAAVVSSGASVANASNDTSASRELACEGKPQGGELINFSCPLASSGTPQRYSLKATFTGSHDDTKLLMVPTINGETVNCDEGGKTSSMYEDGDITLECKFEVTALAGTQTVLMIRLKWYHAQLDALDFVSEQGGTN